MPRKKKEVSEETFELEEVQEEVLEEVPEEMKAEPFTEEEQKELYENTPNEYEYRVTFFISGNNAVLMRKENGRTISRTIPKTKSMKIGDVIVL
jgi:hypothetical protein